MVNRPIGSLLYESKWLIISTDTVYTQVNVLIPPRINITERTENHFFGKSFSSRPGFEPRTYKTASHRATNSPRWLPFIISFFAFLGPVSVILSRRQGCRAGLLFLIIYNIVKCMFHSSWYLMQSGLVIHVPMYNINPLYHICKPMVPFCEVGRDIVYIFFAYSQKLFQIFRPYIF